jgi:peptide subunit release factor RF-3
MKVKETIKYIKLFKFKNLPKFKPELIALLKALETENKKLKKENEARKKMWNIVYEDYGIAVTEDGMLYKEMERIEEKYLKE